MDEQKDYGKFLNLIIHMEHATDMLKERTYYHKYTDNEAYVEGVEFVRRELIHDVKRSYDRGLDNFDFDPEFEYDRELMRCEMSSQSYAKKRGMQDAYKELIKHCRFLMNV